MTEERKFGIVVGGAFALLGSVLALFGSRRAGPVLVGIGALLLFAALVVPAALAPVRRGWMAVARVLGRVNTVVFLSVVYFLVLAPLGFVLRMGGRDELARRGRRASGWVPYPERNRNPRHFEKMF